MKYLFRPLTHKMIDHLEKGRAIELAATGRNFCTSDDFKGTLQGLYRRGLLKQNGHILMERNYCE